MDSRNDDSINKFGDTIVTNSLGKKSIKSLMGTIKYIKIKIWYDYW